MNYLGKIIFFVTIFVAPLQAQEAPTQKRYHVRVLLQEIDGKIPVLWKINSSDGFYIVDRDTKTKIQVDTQELTISFKKNHFFINDQIWEKKRIHIYPICGHLKFENKEYQGSFLIVHDGQSKYLINSIDIEEYVCSVLRTESWPGWPLEVNKVFAIASRSYVIGVVLGNRSSKLPYHVKNTNKHQTYSGVHMDPVLKEAVEQTRGMFLVYEKKPIVAMFDSCCGGVIPAHIHSADFSNAPYLARKYACPFCKDCKVFNWKAQYPLDQFEKMLKKEYKNLKKIKTIKVAKTDKAGLVQQVSVKGQHKIITVPGKKLYSLLSKVRSFCFDIIMNANDVIFTGRGIGHHMGLCQWGAREMVRQGYDYKSILSFYYPDTNFMRL